MEITITHFGMEDGLYQQCLKIREEVLRKPLGMEITTEDRMGDINSIHILCFADGAPAGTVALKGDKLRQMAVPEKFRGHGIGKKLVEYLENLAERREIEEIHLESRNNAITFYEKLGYEPYGEFFDKVGMPHQRMMKKVIKQ